MNKMTITSGASSFTCYPPVYGYQSTVSMGMHISDRSDGRISIFDDGVTFDRRECNCTFILDADDAGGSGTWERFFLAYFFQNDCEILLSSDGGFFPFGPDLGDAGTFGVAFTDYSVESTNNNPTGYFTVSVKMVMQSAPAYSIPGQVIEDSFRLGAIENLRYPQTDPTSVSIPSAVYTSSRSGSTDSLYRGGAANHTHSAYRRETSMEIEGFACNIAALVDHCTTTVRGSMVKLYGPDQTYPYAADGFFPFGPFNPADFGTLGYARCKLASNALTITHRLSNLFSVGISLRYIGD